jgi:hypothetical protein
MQAETGTQIEVMLHSDRSEFARRPRWFLHAVRGGSELACIPRPYGLYNQGRFGNCAKKGIRSPVSEIYRVYTQKSRFFARIPDPASVFAFRHPDRKVLTESSRYNRKVSMFILKSLRISSCSCC